MSQHGICVHRSRKGEQLGTRAAVDGSCARPFDRVHEHRAVPAGTVARASSRGGGANALGAEPGPAGSPVSARGMLLAGAASVLGLVQAIWLTQGFRSLMPSFTPLVGTIGVDRPVLAFTVGVAVFTTVVCGLVPAWRFSQTTRSRHTGDRRGARAYPPCADRPRSCDLDGAAGGRGAPAP